VSDVSDVSDVSEVSDVSDVSDVMTTPIVKPLQEVVQQMFVREQ